MATQKDGATVRDLVQTSDKVSPASTAAASMMQDVALTAADVETGEVVAFHRGVLDLPGRATPVSLLLPESLSEGDWLEVGRRLNSVERSVMWWLGDWWAFGERKGYGERKRIVDSEEWEGPAYQTCRNAASVSRAFEMSRRRDNVSWSAHAELASVEDADERHAMLERAAAERWTVREAKGQSLAIIVAGYIRAAREYEEAKKRGEVDKKGGDRKSFNVRSSDIDTSPATISDIGLDRRRLDEWRKLAKRGELR